MHGTLSDEVFEKLKVLRSGCDLYFDCGDCIKTGNLGIPLGTDPVWAKLDALSVDSSVLGNRETHPLAKVQRDKLRGVAHHVVVANMWNLDGESFTNRSLTFQDVNGLKIGVLGVMVPMATEQKRDKALWSTRWTQPIPEAVKMAESMRAECDLLIALTHIGFKRDIELAQSAPQIDIIFGGHSHTVLTKPHREGRTYICQGGSHNRFAGVYEWSDGELTGELHSLR
jgi:2',3'-cyclic-nucleotide 2'-phosphodiesterase (5'-nucleotidase family)